MKRLFSVFAIFLLPAILLTIMSACAETGFPPNDQPHGQNGMYNGSTDDIEANLSGESPVGHVPGDYPDGGYTAYPTDNPEAHGAATKQTDDTQIMCIPEGLGGDFRECLIHSGHFHSLSIFVDTIVSYEDFIAWSQPLWVMWTSPYSECLVNLSTFIEYFGITREEIQQLIDDIRIERDFDITFGLEINLDVLFSGDRDLIEEFYRIENEAMHTQMADERAFNHYAERLIRLQRIVNENATRMSRHYHDIWTFASFMRHAAGNHISDWMQGLIDAGQYDRVNIVEYVHHSGMLRETFEQIVNEHSMYLFAHYNLDIIFSGDPSLIARYYAIENEAAHTMQVQSALEHHISMYGQPDMSRMLE